MRGIKTGISLMLAIGLLASSAVVVAAQDEPTVEPETPTAAESAAPAATEPTTPAKVTGTLRPGGGPPVQEPTETVVDGVLEARGVAYEGDQLEMDDPRLTGSASVVMNANVHKVSDFIDVVAQAFQLRIENEAGSWSGMGTAFAYGGGAIPIDEAMNLDTVQLTGAGAYEGLTAYLTVDWTEDPAAVQGVIFAGEMPPFPEPALEE